MADNSRIEDLRRRVQKDPASIAFAQLAEELRRARQFEESVEICRTGLAVHPGYLSARVTLGRSLLELNLLDDAQAELEHVLASAPENLAAIRGLAEISHRRGDLPAALGHYRAALALARNDPDLQETVNSLSKKVEPPKPLASADGLSLEEVTRELFLQHPSPKAAQAAPSDFFATVAPPPAPAAADPAASDVFPDVTSPASTSGETASSDFPATATADSTVTHIDADVPSAFFSMPSWSGLAAGLAPPAPAPDVVEPRAGMNPPPAHFLDVPPDSLSAPSVSLSAPLDPHAPRVIAALEHWLEAIHVSRDQYGA